MIMQDFRAGEEHVAHLTSRLPLLVIAVAGRPAPPSLRRPLAVATVAVLHPRFLRMTRKRMPFEARVVMAAPRVLP